MAIISPQPNMIQEADAAYGNSVSEALLTKYGSSINYINKNFDRYYFGVSGADTNELPVFPYFFTQNVELVRNNCVFENVIVTQEISGTSGTTEFNLSVSAGGVGPYNPMMASNFTISNTAANNLVFRQSDHASPPSGVFISNPPLITTFNTGDVLRFAIVQAAVGSRILGFTLVVRPV